MLNEMQNIVLGYPKLKERIESRENTKAEQKKALKNLDEIRADYSPTYIKTFQKLLDASLPKLYDGINFDGKQTNLEEVMKEHCVVLTPNHQSHADYLAINYMFFKEYKRPLYVAGGINLNIFPIGKLFKKSGCFFIRRSFASDITYKLTLEAYLYYLLKTGKPVEFFFEGGRSRTGKLRPPRYGLYNMLLEAHSVIAAEEPHRKMLFIPVSIAHEYVPETKSLADELVGGRKKKESSGQLFGLIKLFAYQFGSVHIRLGKAVECKKESEEDFKKTVQDLAFKCFREVGKNMMITPSSLLATILLDEPSGVLMWKDILAKARVVVNYCQRFNIPITESLEEDSFEATLERAIDIFIGNKKVNVIGKEQQAQLYYSIREESRQELLYFKNTTLHHFLVPYIINVAWVHLFRGQLNSVDDLKKFFLEQRSQLKHEFYLPTVKQFFMRTINVVSDAVGRKITTLEELLELNQKEIYSVISKVGVFGRTLSYITEAYYVSALALNELMKVAPHGFKMADFDKKVKEIFAHEMKLGRVVRYPESYSVQLIRSSVQYFIHQNYIENDSGVIKVIDQVQFDTLIDTYEKDLIDQTTFNIRAQN